jgi:serine/threonine protein phosphatase 1
MSILQHHPFESAVPEGVTVYAVGDIHGRTDLFRILLERLDREKRPPGAPAPILVLLGDYVDRGPDSRGTIDAILSIPPDRFTVVPLMGNHEWTLLTFLNDPRVGEPWISYGGAATLASYGVRLPPGPKRDWRRVSRELAAALPREHRAFFEALRPSFTLGDYFFCHAGARPHCPLTAQADEDLLWIRDEFIKDCTRFEKVVVHGHTVSDAIHSDGRRIGLDAGAYRTEVLAAVRLRGRSRLFFAASPSGARLAYPDIRLVRAKRTLQPTAAAERASRSAPEAAPAPPESSVELLRSALHRASADFDAEIAAISRAREKRPVLAALGQGGRRP